MPLVTIVADAGREAGLGHVSRASAVAVALRCRGVDARYLAHGADAPFERDGIAWTPLEREELPVSLDHVLVIDSYRLTHESLAAAAPVGPMVVMHDYGDPPDEAALLVSVAGEPSTDARRLTGPRYAALRPQFWGLPRRSVRDVAERVLVTTGGGQLAEVGGRLAQAVVSELPDAHVTLVRGPYAAAARIDGVETLDAPESLFDALLCADLVVTAAGQTMLEAVAAGTPCVAVPLVDNQRRQTAVLGELGAIRVVDPADASVAGAVRELMRDADARKRLSTTAQDAVDGFGALRVAYAIDRLVRRRA